MHFCKSWIYWLDIYKICIFFGLPGFVARNTAGNIPTSREKYPLFLLQTWLETSQCLVKNTVLSPQTQLEMSWPAIKKTPLCLHKHGWKHPETLSKALFLSPRTYVLLKNPLFVSTNTAGDVPKSCWKHSAFSQQTCLEMFQHLIKRIQWFHTWKSKTIAHLCTKTLNSFLIESEVNSVLELLSTLKTVETQP